VLDRVLPLRADELRAGQEYVAHAGPEPEPQLVRPAERKVELRHRVGDVTGV